MQFVKSSEDSTVSTLYTFTLYICTSTLHTTCTHSFTNCTPSSPAAEWTDGVITTATNRPGRRASDDKKRSRVPLFR